jgi:hypothetical protein
MEFHIGDRIRVKAYKDLPEEKQSKGFARMAQKVGTVEDRMFSEKVGDFLYRIKFDDFEKSAKLYTADLLEPYSDNVTYYHEFDYLENVVVARFYEVRDDVETEIARGHGHIIHEGAIGIAQAASYALKKILEKMNDGSLTKFN